MLKKDEPNYSRVFLAIFLSAIVLVTWQVKVEWPRRQALAKLATEVKEKREQEKVRHASELPSKDSADAEDNTTLTREQRIAATPRVKIVSEKLNGSLSLKGARFDDLTMVKYRENVDPKSPGVVLFSPNGDEKGFFSQVGWLASDHKTKVPDQNTLWHADKNELKPGQTVNLTWKNEENVLFTLSVTLDQDYMFSVAQKVENKSGRDIGVMPYGYINRTYTMPEVTPFLHEGPLGVMENALNETSFKDLKEKGNKTYETASGWLGIADLYWLAALVPADQHMKITFSHYSKRQRERYQVDYLGDAKIIASGGSESSAIRLFAGAKELQLLDHYTVGDKNSPPIPLFDRSLDFGSFYFLAKPMCDVVEQLFRATGNFGTALLIFIIFVKLAMYPLANKSYKSMSQMRKLQPEMLKIRERYVDDQIGLHKATRDLYKREKVNPAAGCLPMLIQIIVFLALFRGLNVMIELRHAPFYGWIKDLSAADPSNLFTLFGLIPWNTPSWLHLGLLPILYTITMVIQTAQQPQPTDPVQAKMMKWMPYFMLFFFNNMASGFVLYWTWSNILSILQQHIISTRHDGPKEKKKAGTPEAA